MVVRIVQVDDVDAVEAEAPQAVLQGPAHPVGAEVPPPAVRHRDGEPVVQPSLLGIPARQRVEDPPDLGGEGVRGAGPGAQRGAESALREAETVVRGGVEVADALLPSGVHGEGRLLGVDGSEEVADGRGPERELGDLDSGTSQCAAPHACRLPLNDRLPYAANIHRITGASQPGPPARSAHCAGHVRSITPTTALLEPQAVHSGAGANYAVSGVSSGVRGTSSWSAASSSVIAAASSSRSGSALPSATRPTWTLPPYGESATASD